ncbi:hypothetical protein AKJ40_00820 [candidate division MSBL1 archaeon SCGC-AAA259M10]|uniref:Uncharacterized protein n=1 Tax=candidate division MSBL1 archaeon SCGC-AAA259M10 TaxID=1698270 RepID=A0A133V2T3_9EURY|nr:hypothetical protein AKJ40_00820 [candidate division MSBL1 archaeon SCGC-AAA259M10]
MEVKVIGMPRMSPGGTKKAVLRYLSKKNFRDEVTKYRIWKDNEHPKRTTVYNTMGELDEKELLKKKKVGKTPTGQEKYHYAPTLSGVLAALRFNHFPSDDMGEVASKQVELLPLVFGKWDKLMRSENGGKILLPKFTRLRERLWGVFVEPTQRGQLPPEEPRHPPTELSIRRRMYEGLLSPELFENIVSDTRREFIQLVMDDPELSEFVHQLSVIKRNEAEHHLANYRAAAESLEERNPKRFADEPIPEKGEVGGTYALFERKVEDLKGGLSRSNIPEQVKSAFRNEHCPISTESAPCPIEENAWCVSTKVGNVYLIVEAGKLAAFGDRTAKLNRLVLRLEEGVLGNDG